MASAESVSGTYVSSSPGSASLLQIVETSGNHITGRFEQAILNSKKASVDIMNASVDGAVSGSTIVLQIKPNEFLGGTIPASGEIRRGSISITGGGDSAFSLNLTKSSVEMFNGELSALNRSANALLSARNDSEQQNNLKSVIHKLSGFDDYAKKEVETIDVYNKEYKKVTLKMSDYLEKERSTSSRFARGQISVVVFQGSTKASTIYTQFTVDEYYAGYADGVIKTPFQKETISALAFCSKHSNEYDCHGLNESLVNYRSSAATLVESFRQSEAIWMLEHEKQQEIERTSEQIAN